MIWPKSVLRRILRGVAFGAGLAGLAYLAVARRCVADFKARGADRGDDQPPVTIFKPLCGDEPELAENLRSFCEQDYADFRVIFGITDSDDPARAVAERVRASLPSHDIVVAVGGSETAGNPKVANLLNMARAARGDILVIADSDMRVDSKYLRALVAPFADARIGAVTCLYRARPASGFASTLGAMYINAYFAPSVLVAAALQRIGFALGATIAVRRSILEEAGGFAALAPHLADDYALGQLARSSGHDVYLSPYIVENSVTEPSLSTLVQHELRWARTIAAVRPAGYALSGITFPFTLALLYLLLGGNRRRGITLAAAALASRASLQRVAYETLGVRRNDPLWLIPVRDALAFGIWIASFFGRRVTWRARTLIQDRRGHLTGKEPAAW